MSGKVRDPSADRTRVFFMRDRVRNRVDAFGPGLRWHERPAALGHVTLAILAALALVNLLALVPVG